MYREKGTVWPQQAQPGHCNSSITGAYIDSSSITNEWAVDLVLALRRIALGLVTVQIHERSLRLRPPLLCSVARQNGSGVGTAKARAAEWPAHGRVSRALMRTQQGGEERDGGEEAVQRDGHESGEGERC